MIHPTAVTFGSELSKELLWLKTNHPDKLHLIHMAERFLGYLNDNQVIQGQPPKSEVASNANIGANL